MKYVIIGNSTAGIACAEAIRSRDKTGAITILSQENRHCYGRPTISYYLSGDISKEKMKYRPDDFYKNNDIEICFGVSAEKINAAEKRVLASDGKEYSYDKLLVATGSAPFIPKAEGLDAVDYHTFMSFADMERLESRLSPQKSVVIIGAGLIGLKCLEGISKRVKKVTVIDLAERILPSVTDEASAAFIKRHLEENGAEFILGDCARKYTQNSVILKNSGREIPFDILVIAAGVRPNVSLVERAGGAVNRGIVVDNRMMTSLADIYAAGDCAEGYDSSVGKNRVLALLPNAYMQGKTAGINMCGGDAEYSKAIPLNAVGFFGLHMLSAGIYEGQCIKTDGEDSLKELFVKDNKLVGFILINDIGRAGIYTSLVREKTPLDSVDFDMLVKSPQLLAFSAEARAAKLSRRV